ncbi:MAG TPA: AAA family ATPase [Thermoprotei archaeon]|nr:AAA family ATPase [Thermoprotei archaeon]
MEKKVELRVRDAYPRDIDRGIIRIHRLVMEKLGIKERSSVLVEKKGRIVGWVASLAMEEPEDIIRLDDDMKRNLGVSNNDIVSVRAIRLFPAKKIVLVPLDRIENIDRNFENTIHNRLINRPLLRGNIVSIKLFGASISLRVKKISPDSPVYISETTKLVIASDLSEHLEDAEIRYEDIGGLEKEIEKIREMVELPLRFPKIFRHLGIDPPKGVLLHGPPGCGKTLLAKAVANESEASFFAINGPEITSKYYGESEAKLREIFRKAEENAPSIIFIDELDSIAPKREDVSGEAEKRVVAQLLTLMDGLKGRGQVIVIGATNRIDAIDPALRRPGRFDREIEIRIPDEKGRYEIFKIHTRGMPLADDVNIKKLASITHGYTGADIQAICREAAMKALKRNLPLIEEYSDSGDIPDDVLNMITVTMKDFMDAFKEIVPTALREVEVSIPKVVWDDIGGLEEIKEALRENIEWPLKYPDKFKKLGIEPTRGILLYGPPGTGKTLLAQAIASETNMNFIVVKGPELLSKWVGESEKGIRRVFRRARDAAPSIIFFDEIEALVPIRGSDVGSGVTNRVISQFLTEFDGIIRLEDVIVIGATNRPDMIDQALLRPGRMDLMIYVPPPDKEDRLNILKIHTSSTPLDDSVNLAHIAEITDYYTGADLKALVREASMNALRNGRDKVSNDDFMYALETVPPSLNDSIIEWYENYRKSMHRKRIKLPAAFT